MNYFASIDQGTTSTRFIVFNDIGEIVTMHQEEFPQYFPDENSVEHNPIEIWDSVVNCITKVSETFNIADLTSIGITNQRETTLAWSRSTGEPFHNALVWQDTRTQDICDELKNIDSLADEFNKTGLPIATYFSLSKIIWLIRNVDSVKNAINTDDLCFGTIDSWLLYKLTGKHVTDVTNASRTLLLNLETLQWSDSILDTLKIPHSSLPSVLPSMTHFGSNKQCSNYCCFRRSTSISIWSKLYN